MTEAEWLACEDPMLMLRQPNSDRKNRLASCACVRLRGELLVDEGSRRAVEVAEMLADGVASEYERMLTEAKAREVEKGASRQPLSSQFYFLTVAAKMCVIKRPNFSGVCHFTTNFAKDRKCLQAEVAKLVRDIFGNPFRPVNFSQEWHTSTVLALAQQMYDSRDFSPMPILADALQDAGCVEEAILNHCREPGEHVRGCWVVDLVLGKE